jgi:hypothetical protein
MKRRDSASMWSMPLFATMRSGALTYVRNAASVSVSMVLVMVSPVDQPGLERPCRQ